MKNWHIA